MVDEQKAKEGIPSEATAADSNQGTTRSEYDKLKAQNDAFEKELIKAREMRAEMQKLEAERLLAGTAGARVEPQPPKVETAKEYAEKVLSGRFNGSGK